MTQFMWRRAEPNDSMLGVNPGDLLFIVLPDGSAVPPGWTFSESIHKTVQQRKSMNRTYLPTRKWFVSTATTLAGLFTMWATTGTWDQEETVGLITLGLAAFSSYMIPNDSTNTNSP